MNSRSKVNRYVLWTVLLSPLLVVFVRPLGAQTPAPAQANNETQVELPNNPPASEAETINLNPFVVTAQQSDTYTAKDTLAGNRVRTDLSDVGSSVEVITTKFLNDTNSKTMADLLVLTTDTEVAGQGGNFLGQGNGPVLTADPTLTPVTRVRGLEAADITQDFFLTRIPYDVFNTGRVDIQRGPNSLLFGIGSPGGIINGTSNQAAFVNSDKIENQIASFGSLRDTADFNRVILPNELAIRVSWLDDNTKYRQVPAFQDDHRLYGAIRWDPKILNKGSAHTSLTVNAERGTIYGIASIDTPPLDEITPYFTSPYFKNPGGGLQTYTANNVGNAAVTNPWLTSSPAYASPFNLTAFESSGAQGISFYGSGFQWPNTSITNAQDPTPVTGGYFGITSYDIYANQAGLYGSALGAFKAKSLTDSSIFNFYDQLLGGPNSGENDTFTTVTVNLAQSFFNGKVGFDAAYNHESSLFSNWSFLSSYSTAISVDIMSTLPDGQPNPNVGRPMVIGGGESGYGSWSQDDRSTLRLTGYAELDFRDFLAKDSLLAKMLGRHVFTGLIDRYADKMDARGYQTTYISPDANNWQSLSPADGAVSSSEETIVYLGNPINNLSSPSGLNLNRITGTINYSPTTETLWNNVSDSWVTAPLDVINNQAQSNASKVYSSGELLENVINSRVISWQGYLFDGALVPLIGYRTDSEESYLVTAPTLTGTPWVNTQSPLYTLPATATSTAQGHSDTYSLVAHLPDWIRKKLPGNINISPFVNQSENFQPAAGRIDLYGNQLPSPTGKTKEYGVAISALNDRVSFKITRFHTDVDNATVPGANMPLGGAIIAYAWGQSMYYATTHPNLTVPFNWLHTNYGTTSSGQTLNFQPPGSGPYSQAAIDAEYAVQQASIAAWAAGAELPTSIQNVFGMTNYENPAAYASGLSFPPNIAVTENTQSEGTEFELSANPIAGLLLSFNASYVSATQSEIGGTFAAFMAQTETLFNGAAGQMQLFGSNGTTAQSFFQATSLPAYSLLLAEEGTENPEIRPWRFNGTADYTFRHGFAKGVHFGGSYRWESGIITGYPVIVVNGFETYDVNHPYKGATNGTLDVWLGYKRNIGRGFTWSTQLNVRNVFATNNLSVVTSEPDGSPAAMKIPEPRVISWTNTLEF